MFFEQAAFPHVEMCDTLDNELGPTGQTLTDLQDLQISMSLAPPLNPF